MTNLKTLFAQRPNRVILKYLLYLSFFGMAACGYQVGAGSDLSNSAESMGAGRTIAIPLFENATFEPILEKRVTETFKETFFSRGWKVVAPNRASLVLTGRIHRFERTPISLNRDGQAEEYRVKIGMEILLLDPEAREKQQTAPLKREAEGLADYVARADVAADRVAEDRAIREAGRKMAEQVADLFSTKNFFQSEHGADAGSPIPPATE
jgi:outer membrane lipopolysaccharide assembly protein LptE/RlpB